MFSHPHPLRRSPVFSAVCLWIFALLAAFQFGHAVCADDYRIAAEDVLTITVANHAELSADNIVVGTTGNIELPMSGTIQVIGKTLEQIRQEVTGKMKRWLKNPVVTVVLRQQRPVRVSVNGAVRTVGFVPIKPGWRVADALTAAGGLTGLPEDSKATLTRVGGAPQDLKLAELLNNAQSDANLALQEGDRIDVTLIPLVKITVSGDVLRPAVYEVKKLPRVLDALTLSGWLKQKTTATRSFIIRKGKRVDINLVDAVDNKNDAANLQLEADDVLLVEAIPPLTIYVDGLVEKPGVYPIEAGTGVLQAISQAGGLKERTEKITAVVRRGAKNIDVDLAKIAFDPAANIVLMHNDTLLLNERQTIRVQISGEVPKPGLLRLKPGATVLDAIGEAGGISSKREETRISVLRQAENGKPTTLIINPVTLISLEDLRQNAVLQDGDFVSVVQLKPQEVFLTGEVAKPGAYLLQEGEGVAEVLARAGSFTETAALRQVNVTRRATGESQIYDFTPLRNGEKVSVPLAQGDYISVPRNLFKVKVMEGVIRPGPIPMPENRPLTLGDALGAAGGPVAKARTSKIYILRKVNDAVQKQEVSLTSVYNGVPAADIPLQNGDVVFVPGPKPSIIENLLQYPAQLITAAGLLF